MQPSIMTMPLRPRPMVFWKVSPWRKINGEYAALPEYELEVGGDGPDSTEEESAVPPQSLSPPRVPKSSSSCCSHAPNSPRKNRSSPFQVPGLVLESDSFLPLAGALSSENYNQEIQSLDRMLRFLDRLDGRKRTNQTGRGSTGEIKEAYEKPETDDLQRLAKSPSSGSTGLGSDLKNGDLAGLHSCSLVQMAPSFDTAATEEDSSDTDHDPLKASATHIAALLQRPVTIKWGDEHGNKLETIYDIPLELEATVRLVILLTSPLERKFEFLHAEFSTEERLTVSDMLQQLPHLAVTPQFSKIPYMALCREDGTELINMLSVQEYDHWRDGELVVAVPQGCRPKEVVAMARELLRDKTLRRAVKKARVTGKALQVLKSSDDWHEYKSTLKKRKKRKKQDKRDNGKSMAISSPKGDKKKKKKVFLASPCTNALDGKARKLKTLRKKMLNEFEAADAEALQAADLATPENMKDGGECALPDLSETDHCSEMSGESDFADFFGPVAQEVAWGLALPGINCELDDSDSDNEQEENAISRAFATSDVCSLCADETESESALDESADVVEAFTFLSLSSIDDDDFDRAIEQQADHVCEEVKPDIPTVIELPVCETEAQPFEFAEPSVHATGPLDSGIECAEEMQDRPTNVCWIESGVEDHSSVSTIPSLDITPSLSMVVETSENESDIEGMRESIPTCTPASLPLHSILGEKPEELANSVLHLVSALKSPEFLEEIAANDEVLIDDDMAELESLPDLVSDYANPVNASLNQNCQEARQEAESGPANTWTSHQPADHVDDLKATAVDGEVSAVDDTAELESLHDLVSDHASPEDTVGFDSNMNQESEEERLEAASPSGKLLASHTAAKLVIENAYLPVDHMDEVLEESDLALHPCQSRLLDTLGKGVVVTLAVFFAVTSQVRGG